MQEEIQQYLLVACRRGRRFRVTRFSAYRNDLGQLASFCVTISVRMGSSVTGWQDVTAAVAQDCVFALRSRVLCIRRQWRGGGWRSKFF
jgi:hypothetical protein